MDILSRWYKDLQIEKWLADNGIEIIVILFGSIVIYYVVGFLLERVIRQAVRSAGKHRDWHRKDMEKRQKTLSDLFRNIWRVIVILSAAVAIFTKIIPIDLSPLFASAGIIGIALGFGAQSLIRDFLSGIFIIAENQYRVGDIIDIEGSTGTVERIGTRSTVLRDFDGNVHYFPNGMVQHVMNKTMGYSMARFSIAVTPSADIDTVVGIINEIGLQLAGEETWKEKILAPPAFVSINEFSGNSVSLLIAGKTQPSDQWSVTAEMRRRLLEAFEAAKIDLAITPIIGQTTATTPRAK